jgi:hypothetical protein
VSARRAAAALALAALGCASSLAPAFDPRFPDGDRVAQARVLALLSDEPAPAPVEARLVAATAAPRGLVLVDLASGRVRWRVEAEVETQPVLLGDLVLSTERGALVAFDAASGRRRWQSPLDGLHHVGAARAGETLLVVASAPNADGRAQSRVSALDPADGSLRWRYDVPAAGRPVATAHHFLVPWQRRHLSVIDARDGRGCCAFERATTPSSGSSPTATASASATAKC